MSGSAVFSAIGAVLGYIGAEAATPRSFEELLWPQRFFSNFTIWSAPQLALTAPMGGPLHKAALETLDAMFVHGIFKGPREGHMLCTAFFPIQGWTYIIHDRENNNLDFQSKQSRNCLWIQALRPASIPALDMGSPSGTQVSMEKGMAMAHHPIRAKVSVSHVTFSRATAKDKESTLPFVSENERRPDLRGFLAICTAELTGIVVAVGVFAAYQSPWGVLWLAPLFLRLVSAFFALHREPLAQLSPHSADEASWDFEIHSPQSQETFMVFTGPPSLVQQFFRHYGHPVRSRFREVVQLAIIFLMGSQFPFGLLASALWMPIQLQYVWICYQVYVVLAMYIVRYTHSGRSATTVGKIASCFGLDGAAENQGVRSHGTILFGQDRNGPGTVKVSAVTTYHTRHREGSECVEQLLQRSKVGAR